MGSTGQRAVREDGVLTPPVLSPVQLDLFQDSQRDHYEP